MGRERPWEGGGCCGECVGLCTRALPRLSRSLRRRSVLGLCVLPVLWCTIPRRRPWLSVVVVWRAALGGRPPFLRDGWLSAGRPASGYGASYPPCMHGARGRGVRGRLPGGSHFQGFVCLLFFGRRAELLLLFWCGFPGPCLRGCSWSECNADTARSVTLRKKGGRVQPHPQG